MGGRVLGLRWWYYREIKKPKSESRRTSLGSLIVCFEQQITFPEVSSGSLSIGQKLVHNHSYEIEA